MKKLLLLALLGWGTTAWAQRADPKAEKAAKTSTVYITKTGARYHLDGCRHLHSRIPVSLALAVKQGYTPCKVCRPGTVTREAAKPQASKPDEKADSCKALFRDGSRCKDPVEKRGYCDRHQPVKKSQQGIDPSSSPPAAGSKLRFRSNHR